MALSLQNIQVSGLVAEAIILTYEGILEKEGEFSINDITEIYTELSKKYSEPKTEQENPQPSN